MAFVPAPFCVKVVPKFSLPGGGTAVNVLTFRNLDAPTTISQLETLAGVYDNWWGATAKSLVSNQVALVEVVITALDTASDLQFIYTPASPIAGTLSAAALPAQVTLATAFKSTYSGRSRRGRAYWIGLAENEVTGDYVITATADNIRNAWETLGTDAAAESWQHCVLSYVEDGVARTEALVTYVNYYVNVDTRVDTQRRRLPGSGS